MLLVGVHDPDGTGDLGHEADTTEGALELVALTAQAEQLTLGHAAGGDVVEVDLLELLEPLQPLVDGLEVGEHAAEPALVHVRHADALRLLSDGFLCLLLRADEQDAAAVGDGLLDELVGVVQVTESLVQIDDVDAVAVGEDEPLHLRVPPAGLVSEVDARLQQLAHGDDCHGCSFRAARRFPVGRAGPDGRHPDTDSGPCPWGPEGSRPTDSRRTVCEFRSVNRDDPSLPNGAVDRRRRLVHRSAGGSGGRTRPRHVMDT